MGAQAINTLFNMLGVPLDLQKHARGPLDYLNFHPPALMYHLYLTFPIDLIDPIRHPLPAPVRPAP